ncbi:Uncharacterised protein [Bordetella pertussis]|nr:Uncharacterised protein [Bordetella pertussis]
MYGTSSNTCSWISRQIFFCASRSGALNQSMRSCSRRSLVGQPNQACLPLPRMGRWPAGSRLFGPVLPVNATLQPPADTGSWLLRRCTAVPQSMVCRSTLKPRRLNRSAVTSAAACQVGKSTGSSSTTFSPL